jgi:hypothetical protein
MLILVCLSIFLVTFYTTSSSSCFLTSLINHRKKQNLLNLIYEHDKFMMEEFEILLNYEKIHNFLSNCFKIFITVSTASVLSFFYSMFTVNPEYLIYTIQIHIPNHIIYMQAFQIFTFLRGIELRLKLLKSCDFEDKKMELKKSLLNIYDICKELYNCLGITCFLSCSNIFTVILINMYWFFLMCFNFSQSSVLGEFYSIWLE